MKLLLLCRCRVQRSSRRNQTTNSNGMCVLFVFFWWSKSSTQLKINDISFFFSLSKQCLFRSGVCSMCICVTILPSTNILICSRFQVRMTIGISRFLLIHQHRLSIRVRGIVILDEKRRNSHSRGGKQTIRFFFHYYFQENLRDWEKLDDEKERKSHHKRYCCLLAIGQPVSE